MNSKILSEIIEKHETADSFISLFFALIDTIIYIVILFIFGCEFNKKIFLYSQKHSLLLILYTVLRFINLYIPLVLEFGRILYIKIFFQHNIMDF